MSRGRERNKGKRRKKKGSEREDDMWSLHVNGSHIFFLMTSGPVYFFYFNAT
jgi:hypothetical protein